MLVEEKAVGNMWAFFVVSMTMSRYTLFVDHKIDAQERSITYVNN
jgi:hypothetical protein